MDPARLYDQATYMKFPLFEHTLYLKHSILYVGKEFLSLAERVHSGLQRHRRMGRNGIAKGKTPLS